MGAGISHCEEKHEEPASGQQEIQSSDTASKRKPTNDMPKDAGKSKSKNADEKSAPTKQGKDQSPDDSKPPTNPNDSKSKSKVDSKSAPEDDGSDSEKGNSQSASKPDSKTEGKDSKPESKADSKSDSEADTTVNSKDENKDASKDNSEGRSKQDEDKGSDVDAGDSEEAEEPKITKEDVKSTPYDHRFPSFNQARHCFTKYNEFYKCTAEKGDDSSECKFHQKAYRSICPSEWLDKWNEQRESGTWPGRY
ncbi:TPA: hypothetical protein ACH3X1_001620 [Trebouxia sp. C0004]